MQDTYRKYIFGIQNVDELFKEGINVGQMVLISGKLGTGKTTLARIGQRGLSASTGSGKVYIVTGKHNKGDILYMLNGKGFIDHSYKTICLGDGFNDIPMLKICDIPILLGGNHEIAEKVGRNDLIFLEERGPDVWLNIVKKVMGF